MTQNFNPDLYRPNVGVMLMNSIGEIFVAQRIDSPGPAWQMPQGGIDPGEDPQRAALRELEEETGITEVKIIAQLSNWVYYDLPQDLQGKLWGGGYVGQRQMWFLARYHGRDEDINIETDTPEFSEWKWVHPDKVMGLIVPFKRDVYRKIISEFQPHLKRIQ